MTNPIIKIEVTEANWLVAYYADGRNTVLGCVSTLRGAKAMLTRRAKQFGLTVKGDIAEK